MKLTRGILEQKFNVNRACFPKEKTPEFTNMGEIHELFVLALSLLWFAGATPDCRWGEAFFLQLELFLLTVELLCLQSVEVLTRLSHCKPPMVSRKAPIVNQKAPKHYTRLSQSER